jgi:hypothetical protein
MFVCLGASQLLTLNESTLEKYLDSYENLLVTFISPHSDSNLTFLLVLN